jgi:hypothetical protein
MSQSDYNIANDSAPAVRAKLNTVFESIATNNAGASAPSSTFPHQWWYDATTNILRQRNAADDAWIDIGQFDQTAGTFQPIGTPQLTQVQVEDDTDTTFGTVSGERLAQFRNEYSIGWGQTWQDVSGSRTHSTSYQNTTGRPIMVAIVALSSTTIGARNIEVSTDNSSWVRVGRAELNDAARAQQVSFVVPPGHFYRIDGATSTASVFIWSELR